MAKYQTSDLNFGDRIVDLDLQQQQQVKGGNGINYELLSFLEKWKDSSVVTYGPSSNKDNTFVVNVVADLGEGNNITQT